MIDQVVVTEGRVEGGKGREEDEGIYLRRTKREYAQGRDRTCVSVQTHSNPFQKIQARRGDNPGREELRC